MHLQHVKLRKQQCMPFLKPGQEQTSLLGYFTPMKQSITVHRPKAFTITSHTLTQWLPLLTEACYGSLPGILSAQTTINSIELCVYNSLSVETKLSAGALVQYTVIARRRASRLSQVGPVHHGYCLYGQMKNFLFDKKY